MGEDLFPDLENRLTGLVAAVAEAARLVCSLKLDRGVCTGGEGPRTGRVEDCHMFWRGALDLTAGPTCPRRIATV